MSKEILKARTLLIVVAVFGLAFLPGNAQAATSYSSNDANLNSSNTTATTTNDGQNTTSANCLRESTANASITVAGDRATAHFTLPSGCKGQVVSLVSYKAPNGTDGKPYSSQELFRSTTRTFNNEGRREMSVQLPDCYYQVDLVTGQPLQSFANGVTYHGQHRFLVARHGGNKFCSQPMQTQPAAQPATTPPASVNVNTTAASNVTAAAKETPAPQHAPQTAPPSGKLPDTGPGTIAAFGFGSTFTASLIYVYRSRFSEILSKIIDRYHL